MSAQTIPLWNGIKDASDKVKIELISLLSSSLILPEPAQQKTDEDWIKMFAGKWQDNRSAEEIIEDIRESRTPMREVEL